MKIKSILWTNFALISFFCAFAPVNIAVPYDERVAWCTDRLDIRNSNYGNTKIYKECMKTAAEEIRKYEKKKEEEREQWRLDKIKWEKEKPERERKERIEKERKMRIKKDAELKRKAEKLRKEAEARAERLRMEEKARKKRENDLGVQRKYLDEFPSSEADLFN
jgi:DNA repair exonuclease SbcCD ATPase subunit